LLPAVQTQQKHVIITIRCGAQGLPLTRSTLALLKAAQARLLGNGLIGCHPGFSVCSGNFDLGFAKRPARHGMHDTQLARTAVACLTPTIAVATVGHVGCQPGMHFSGKTQTKPPSVHSSLISITDQLWTHQHVNGTVEMKLSRGSTSVQVQLSGLGVPRPPKSSAHVVTAAISSSTACRSSKQGQQRLTESSCGQLSSTPVLSWTEPSSNCLRYYCDSVWIYLPVGLLHGAFAALLQAQRC